MEENWKCNSNLTYPPLKLNWLQTTGPRYICPHPWQFIIDTLFYGTLGPHSS
jgi:hypothetical protein